MAWKFTSIIYILLVWFSLSWETMEGLEERDSGGANRADCNHDFFPFDHSAGLISALLAQCSCPRVLYESF